MIKSVKGKLEDPRIIAGIILATVRSWILYSGIEGIGAPADFTGEQGTLFFPFVVLIVLVLFIRPLLVLFDSIHVIGAHHIYSINGRCSLVRQRVEIPYEDMRGIRIEQGLVGRIIDIGTLIIWTAEADVPAVKMHGIGKPQEIAEEIRQRIDATHIRHDSKK